MGGRPKYTRVLEFKEKEKIRKEQLLAIKKQKAKESRKRFLALKKELTKTNV